MLVIPLSTTPNQTFSTRIGSDFYNITIKFVINLMTVSVVRNGVILIENVRAMPDEVVIPYEHLEAGSGNFAFVTENNEYPIYTQFNITQYLVFADNEELEVLRGTV